VAERDDREFWDRRARPDPLNEIVDLPACVQADQQGLWNAGVEQGMRELFEVVPGVGQVVHRVNRVGDPGFSDSELSEQSLIQILADE
jgi:hypothetical protein